MVEGGLTTVGRGEMTVVAEAEPEAAKTYYGRPVLKVPTWRWYIPGYFFAGGLAAGSSLLAAAAMATGDETVSTRARWTALASIGAGAAFLVADLGRPERFHHMLRVAKLSSPMSVGTWVLTVYGPAVGAAAFLRPVRPAATWLAAATAPLVGSYTAVLLSDTAVPAWHDARGLLPSLFVASALASAGGAALMSSGWAGDDRYGPVARLSIAAAGVEVITAAAMERRLEPEVRRAYERGRPRLLGRVAKTAGVAGAALIAVGARRRSTRAVGGGLLVLGSACERFAVVAAGSASAADPLATTVPQRRRIDAGSRSR